MKVPFKMPEIFLHTLGGGLEIWASIVGFTCKAQDDESKDEGLVL